jgi:hypothetical protein
MIRDKPPRVVQPMGAPTNWHLHLRNVQRCPECGARVAMPCRACAVRAEVARKKKLAALRAMDVRR